MGHWKVATNDTLPGVRIRTTEEQVSAMPNWVIEGDWVDETEEADTNTADENAHAEAVDAPKPATEATTKKTAASGQTKEK